MSSLEKGMSFPISSEYISAMSVFTKSNEIIMYVEGWLDVNFWSRFFRDDKFTVSVKPYGQCANANGKGSIISAVKDGGIELGPNLIVGLDSDLDFIFDCHSDIFSSEFVFQTYAYSIENFYWSPQSMDIICQRASKNVQFLPDGDIHGKINEWLKSHYLNFLSILKDGPSDTDFTNFLSTIRFHNGEVVFSMPESTATVDEEFLAKARSKGVFEDSYYLFIRGHNFEARMNEICQSVVGSTFFKVKDELIKQHGDGAGQFISEYKNAQCEPQKIAHYIDADCKLCFPKIRSDVASFKESYFSEHIDDIKNVRKRA